MQTENQTNTSVKIYHDSLDAQSRISRAASELFASKGFESTSMRMIASKAGVSLASINYHFNSKSELYCSVLIKAHTKIDSDSNRLIEKEKTFSDGIVAFFEHCCNNSAEIQNVHSMMTSELNFDDHLRQKLEGTFRSPPGFSALSRILDLELKRPLPLEVKFWLINNALMYAINWVVLASPKTVIGNIHECYKIGQKEKITMLKMHCEAVLSYSVNLKSTPPICAIPENVRKNLDTA